MANKRRVGISAPGLIKSRLRIAEGKQSLWRLLIGTEGAELY